MKDVAIITIVERSLLCLTGVAAVFLTGSLAMVGVAYLVTFVSSLALSTYLFRRNIGPFRPAFSRAAWAPMMREALPFLTASILSTIWTRVDIYFLTTFRTPAEVGSYNAALRVVEAQIFIPVAILGSVFPVLSRLQGGPPREFNRILGKNFVFLLAAGLTVAAGTYLLSGPIISILFGDGYRDSAAILRIFSPMIVFSFLHYLTSGALVAMGRELLTTLTLGLGAVVCVTLGFIFIPGSGAQAAGLIKVAAEGLSFGIQGAVLVWMIVKSRGAAAHQPQSSR
jgi:O-antigen/teichoic acid export membrane protein